MTPKAKLLIIGGAEDKGDNEPLDILDQKKEFTRYEILNELLPPSNKKIEIITTGSEIQDEVKKIYQRVFQNMGYSNIGFLPIKNRSEARQDEYLKRAEDAGAIFFTGGDQFRLSTILGGTPIVDIIKERYQEDSEFIIAGTSAGAMVMGTVMITGGGLSEALRYRNLLTSSGLGILQSCIIDTHFIKRGRFSRLAHAIIMNPEQLGIGLGEDTALVIRNGSDAECYGSGMVVIIDGRTIDQTNITEVEEGEPVFVENLIVHLLVKGCQFSIADRTLANPAIPVSKQSK
ncbi:cyanophycinase [Fluoribacter gormanii]|uniref:Cyanophycinase n=1 Tax=Fluoribacter gormanii TaxID=464 RepID=A0A377GM61_9GAMM|nr:cyanophycinase [Fluoribacter gormanii]KTD04956.1 cyanophycinase [Fluoribacter gormanii]MCW8442808.1 cyanophycinase [Fluoribacter gormanii]MCW8471280.1 cyanophycinase [Fluoribacter gormanii]SIR54471.1 cyanophycinase [Fluoribacter gormanii]STO25585.1 Cyanophycinase [Fluoribacter gormanii]